MREEFEKMVAAGKIEGRHLETLVQLATSGFCLHRSWGFGRIRSVDTVFARFTIDFPNRPGHTMDLDFAAESLKPIARDHILARKATELDGLRQLAAAHPLELLRLVLQSYGGRATAEQIQQVLVPDIIQEDWKKWWESARREMRKDGHFLVPTKKTDAIVYQQQEVSPAERALAEFRAAKGLKARVGVATEMWKNAGDLGDLSLIADEVIAGLNAEILTHQRTQPAVALEAIFIRDDLRARAQLPADPGELTAAAIWAHPEAKLGPVLEQIPAAKHRRALESFCAARPDTWPTLLLETLNLVSARLCKEFVSLLVQHGHLPSLKDTLARLISQHAASSELLLWLARDHSDLFADILGPEVFRAMLSAMDRDQFNERRSSRLHDALMDDPELVVELFGAADLEVIHDLIRALQLSPCFDDMEKRSLLARIIKSEPAVQTLISGEQQKQDATLLVSWESLERRKNEYQELVHKKIPANSREIAIARSYGDLSENHEYKAAKENQKLLLRRKAELEEQLVRARGTDFANPRTDVVSVGTCVRLTDLLHPHTETLTILGAWDTDPDRGIISYLSPLAQALLGHRPGDEVEFETDHEKRHYRIEEIQPYRRPAADAPAAEPVSVAPPAIAPPAEPEPPEAPPPTPAGQPVVEHSQPQPTP